MLPCHANNLLRPEVMDRSTPTWRASREAEPTTRVRAGANRNRRETDSANAGQRVSRKATETGYELMPVQRMRPGACLLGLRSGFRRERLGSVGNRRLKCTAESIHMNTGGHPETNVPSSRGEKHGWRRCRHSTRGPGKPATWGRAAGGRRPE